MTVRNLGGAWVVLAALVVSGCPERLVFDDAYVNQAPTLEVVKTDAVEGTEDASISITASDPDGNRLKVTVTGWIGDEVMTFTGGAQGHTEERTKPATCSDLGEQPVRVHVTDGLLETERTVTILISEGTDKPTFSTAPLLGGQARTQYRYDPVVEAPAVAQPCGEKPSILLSEGPTGMQFDPDAWELRWTPSPDQAGEDHFVKLTAVFRQEITEIQQWTINVPNRPPAIQGGVSPDLDYLVGVGGIGEFAAIDEDGHTLTWSLLDGAPTGMTIEDGGQRTEDGQVVRLGRLVWSPTADQAGEQADDTHTYTVVATDEKGQASAPVTRQAYVWIDGDSDRHCAVDLRPGDAPDGAMCQDGVQDCDDDSATVHPGADEQCDSVDNDCDRATDEGIGACNPGNVAPVIDDGGGPALHWLAGVEGGGALSATDPDPGDGLQWALVEGPDGMVIDEDTGDVTWTPTNDQQGEHEYTVEVSDEFGARSNPVIRDALVWKDDDGDGWCETEVDAVEVPDDFCANGLTDCEDDDADNGAAANPGMDAEV